MSKPKVLDAVVASAATSSAERDSMKSAMAVLSDNVAKYYFEGTDQEVWDELKDFPNLAPPFPVMWFEYTPTARIVSEINGVTHNSEVTRYRYGFLIQSVDFDLASVMSDIKPESVLGMLEMPWAVNGQAVDKSFLEGAIKTLKSAIAAGGSMKELVAESFKEWMTAQTANSPQAKARWASSVTAYLMHDNQLVAGGIPLCGFQYCIDKDGKMIAMGSGLGGLNGGVTKSFIEWADLNSPNHYAMLVGPDGKPDVGGCQSWLKMFTTAFHVPMLSISFMHCKNVQVVATGGNKPQKKNRHKPPKSGVRYHVLEIQAMQEILRNAGKTAPKGQGARMALNICRGHFKTYGRPVLDESGAQVVGPDGTPLTTPGLFGREALKGTFWWPSHVRGSAAAGEVKKSYCVNAPT